MSFELYPTSLFDKSQFLPTHVLVFSKDIKVKKPASLKPKVKRSKRGKVNSFSEASRNRLLFYARNSGHHIQSQIMLSYPEKFEHDGAEVKRHLNAFLTLLREKYPDIIYIWVMEFQERGAAHFHLFTNLKACSFKDHKKGRCNPFECDRVFHRWAAETWADIVSGENPEAHEKMLKVHNHLKNFGAWDMRSGRYLTKEYLAKAAQKEIPEEYYNIGRFWGCSRNFKPTFFVCYPGEEFKYDVFYQAIRQVTRVYEKRIEKYILEKTGKFESVKIRRKTTSYTLPLMSDLFDRFINYFDYGEIPCPF